MDWTTKSIGIKTEEEKFLKHCRYFWSWRITTARWVVRICFAKNRCWALQSSIRGRRRSRCLAWVPSSTMIFLLTAIRGIHHKQHQRRDNPCFRRKNGHRFKYQRRYVRARPRGVLISRRHIKVELHRASPIPTGNSFAALGVYCTLDQILTAAKVLPIRMGRTSISWAAIVIIRLIDSGWQPPRNVRMTDLGPMS